MKVTNVAFSNVKTTYSLTGCLGPCRLAALQAIVEKLCFNWFTNTSDLFKNILDYILKDCIL